MEDHDHVERQGRFRRPPIWLPTLYHGLTAMVLDGFNYTGDVG